MTTSPLCCHSLSSLAVVLFLLPVWHLDAQPTESEFPQIQRINALIESAWGDHEIKPSEPATDAEWCRRIHLDLIGRIPTVSELDAFVSNRSKSKREQLVNTLLFDDVYTVEFVRNWTTIWSNLLIGRTGGNDRDSLIDRTGMQEFLRESLTRNQPYDEFVRQLVTATGTTTPGADGFDGATNFLIDKVNEDKASQATAKTSQLFLGVQIQCTQCHNHPFNDWKQQKYWELNAFFRQVRAFRGGASRMDSGPAQLADQDFPGENDAGDFDKPAIFYELRNGEARVAYPVFIDGTEIDASGYVNVVNRRKALADLIIDSPWFAQAISNRIWAHFLGYGFTSPIDDLGTHNPASHPELLDFLSGEFRNSGFDLRQLIAWTVLSKPYALSSKVGKSNQSDDPLLGEAPRFSRFYLRQMRAEELYESLMVANQAGQSRGNSEEQEQLRNRWLQQFSQAFGTDEGDETTTFNGTIPQVLMMFNGELVQTATGDMSGNMIDLIVSNSGLDFQDQVNYLFKAGLSRKAKKAESQMAQQFLSIYDGNRYEALKDLWWVILNSNEFIFNH